jgi:ATP-binding cassette subfamily D (ALD) long-chain fatty acid import protein
LIHRIGELIESCEHHSEYADQMDEEACSDNSSMGMSQVTVATPGGMKLIDNLSFNVAKGNDLIIMGQSGCGKSSLLRVLSGLWPAPRGIVTRPLKSGSSGFLFLPQKSYVTEGTFLEQIIYPIEDTGVYDDQVMEIVRMADLESLVKTHGLNKYKFWEQIFSGGELQRIGFARLFFHRPAFALMDEATSALDMELEAKLMTQAKALGITMINVAHRPSLMQYHNVILDFKREGDQVAYELKKLPLEPE